jgi:hypothetical protein
MLPCGRVKVPPQLRQLLAQRIPFLPLVGVGIEGRYPTDIIRGLGQDGTSAEAAGWRVAFAAEELSRLDPLVLVVAGSRRRLF